nr:hypothetical protein CFP56_60730 [Quercus suber]
MESTRRPLRARSGDVLPLISLLHKKSGEKTCLGRKLPQTTAAAAADKILFLGRKKQHFPLTPRRGPRREKKKQAGEGGTLDDPSFACMGY